MNSGRRKSELSSKSNDNPKCKRLMHRTERTKGRPDGPRVATKSGGGEQTRRIVALVTSESRRPRVIAIFLSDADADFAARNAALQESNVAVMAVIRLGRKFNN